MHVTCPCVSRLPQTGTMFICNSILHTSGLWLSFLAAQINIVVGFIILIHFPFHLFHDLALLSMKVPCSLNVSAHTQGLTRFPSLSCVLRTLSDLGNRLLGKVQFILGVWFYLNIQKVWYPLPFPCILALYAYCHGRWGSCVIPRWLCKIFITISCQQSKATGFAEHLLPSDIRSQGYKQSWTAFSLVVHLMLEIAVVISVSCLWIRLEWCCYSITFFTTVAEGGQIFMRFLLFSFMLPCYCVFLWRVVLFCSPGAVWWRWGGCRGACC